MSWRRRERRPSERRSLASGWRGEHIDGSREAVVERHQVGAERRGQPEVARVMRRRARGVGEQDDVTRRRPAR
jgi:hypothetical protein